VHVYGPQGALGEVPLPEVEVVLGREPGPQGLQLDDETASRCHAEISYSRTYDCYRVRDLGSKNGVFVDGRRVQDAVLDAESVLRVGANLFVLEELRVPDGDEIQPPSTVSLTRAWAEHLVDRAGPSPLSILVRGPTGAGKERLARRAHEASGRTGALVPVNCAAISPSLIGSELFGHVRGAFSEAKSDRNGLIASADGGTLFLDEIAELPLEQQSSLLRVLQERRVRPVGADRDAPVDVRFVSATHQDLAAAQRNGSFRADLYGRLAGIEVELPGLARRRVEILPLLAAFAPGVEPDAEAAERLLVHAWPLNVRELEHLAQRLALFDARTFGVDRLPETMVQDPPDATPSTADSPPRPPSARAEPPTRDELDALLTEHRGRVADVARALAVTRQSVYRSMEAFGLSAAAYRRRKT